MNPIDHIIVENGEILYDEVMRELLDRADADARMVQLHMAFEATDDADAQSLLLDEIMARMEELARLMELQ